VLLGLVGAACLVWGGVGVADLPRPLDLHDSAQQLPAFLVTAGLIGGGTAVWLALTLLLRVPTSQRARPADRVPYTLAERTGRVRFIQDHGTRPRRTGRATARRGRTQQRDRRKASGHRRVPGESPDHRPIPRRGVRRPRLGRAHPGHPGAP